MTNIVEPSVDSLGPALQQPVSQETFLSEFKRTVDYMVQLLKEQPAIVAHSQNTFDGSGARRLLSNKFELEKVSDTVWSPFGSNTATTICLYDCNFIIPGRPWTLPLTVYQKSKMGKYPRNIWALRLIFWRRLLACRCSEQLIRYL